MQSEDVREGVRLRVKNLRSDCLFTFFCPVMLCKNRERWKIQDGSGSGYLKLSEVTRVAVKKEVLCFRASAALLALISIRCEIFVPFKDNCLWFMHFWGGHWWYGICVSPCILAFMCTRRFCASCSWEVSTAQCMRAQVIPFLLSLVFVHFCNSIFSLLFQDHHAAFPALTWTSRVSVLVPLPLWLLFSGFGTVYMERSGERSL